MRVAQNFYRHGTMSDKNGNRSFANLFPYIILKLSKQPLRTVIIYDNIWVTYNIDGVNLWTGRI